MSLATLLVIAAFVLAYQFIKPAPPDRVVMATGSVDGAYHAFARRYAESLAREGIELELRPTAGSVENAQLLAAGEADATWTLRHKNEWDVAAGVALLALRFLQAAWDIVKGRSDRLIASHEAEEMLEEVKAARKEG